VAYNTNWLLEPFQKFTGRRVKTINIVGGGAQSDIWCQIFADVMNVEVRQVTDPVYANARGAAWIGAVGLKELAFSDIPGLVSFKKIYMPDPQNRALYTEKFNVFKLIYRQMKGIYKRLNR
jgi:xylulokinase